MTSKEALGLKADEVAIRLSKHNKEIIYRALQNEVRKIDGSFQEYVRDNIMSQLGDEIYVALAEQRDKVFELAESLVNGTLEL
jgi:hypothetical protein